MILRGALVVASAAATLYVGNMIRKGETFAERVPPARTSYSPKNSPNSAFAMYIPELPVTLANGTVYNARGSRNFFGTNKVEVMARGPGGLATNCELSEKTLLYKLDSPLATIREAVGLNKHPGISLDRVITDDQRTGRSREFRRSSVDGVGSDVVKRTYQKAMQRAGEVCLESMDTYVRELAK